MSLREYFAAMAMQGLCSNNYWTDKLKTFAEDEKLFAKAAVEYADALIEELNKSDT